MLFDAAGFVDDAFEDAASGFGVERGFGGFAQAVEKRALARGVVDGNIAFAFVFADRHHQAHAIVQ
jgi:hypothetical protein